MSIASEMTDLDIAEAIADADVRVLLMVLVHLTGDERWLAAPYRPKRDVRLIPDPGAGLAPEVQQEIRDAACELLSEGAPAAIKDPGNALMQRMMSVCLGEEVPQEYAELNREEMGIISRVPQWKTPPKAKVLDEYGVLIVGAGVSGISLAVNLERLGIPYTIVEQKSWLGGSWNANRYPGCGVDTPNHSYSGACQGSCRLIYAAKGCLRSAFMWSATTESRSGLRVTAPIGDQSRVVPDQRAGLRSRALRYSSCRAARMA